MQDHVGADGFPLAFGDRVAVRSGGDPAVGRIGAEGLRDDRNLIRHHERGIEAYTELTDHVRILGVLAFSDGVPEFACAAGGDHAEIRLKLLLRHADAVIRHRQRAGFLVRVNADHEILPLHTHALICQRAVAELVNGVGGVRQNLPQEYFLVRVNGVDHQIQKALGFRLELLFCHIDLPFGISFSTLCV